jgi:hypothetical protein
MQVLLPCLWLSLLSGCGGVGCVGGVCLLMLCAAGLVVMMVSVGSVFCRLMVEVKLVVEVAEVGLVVDEVEAGVCFLSLGWSRIELLR